jgi:hypothetical protein
MVRSRWRRPRGPRRRAICDTTGELLQGAGTSHEHQGFRVPRKLARVIDEPPIVLCIGIGLLGSIMLWFGLNRICSSCIVLGWLLCIFGVLTFLLATTAAYWLREFWGLKLQESGQNCQSCRGDSHTHVRSVMHHIPPWRNKKPSPFRLSCGSWWWTLKSWCHRIMRPPATRGRSMHCPRFPQPSPE